MDFINEWANQAAEQIAIIKGIPYDQKLINKILKVGKAQLQTKEMIIHNNLTQVVEEGTTEDLLDYYLGDDKPLMTGYGVLYQQHEGSLNLPAKMLAYLGSERKVVKKKMFEHVNDVDKGIYNAYDTKQKVIKVLANSFYGVMGQKSFIFHNEYNGPAITYTAYQIITNSMLSIEAFMANNVRFKNFDQIIQFITNSLKTTPRTPIEQIIGSKKVFKCPNIIEYLVSMSDFDLTEKEIDLLNTAVGGLVHEEIWLLYFKRNLFEFLKQPKIIDMLGDCLDGDFVNPDEPPEAVKPTIDALYELLVDYVSYDYLYEDRFERSHELVRQVILVVDTDSNFISLMPFYDFMADQFDLGDKDDKEAYIPVCNIITHILSRYIHRTLHLFANNMNLTKDNQKFLAMKSEFLFSRVLLTNNKKQYAANIVATEGNVLDKPKLELKGISIKKTGLNKATRTYFTKILEDMMLNAKEIDIPAILRKYWEYERAIVKGLTEDLSTQFCTPGKYSSIDSYKNYAQMDVVRGTMLWNYMNESRPIGNHSKINKIKLRSMTKDELKEAMKDFPEDLEALLELMEKDEVFKKYGLDILALPKDLETIPDWVRPLMDVSTMASDIMRNAIVLLESLGVQLLTIRSKNYYSNILQM
jgi:DNA polymerase elongation subunit (family B)